MPETNDHHLSGVSETLLLTLYLRAMESKRPDALIKDGMAEALVKKISDNGLYDFNKIERLPLKEANKLVLILRNRQFDRYTQDFLQRNPDTVVVHIGCGLDARFERVDNGRVEWYDLDLPEVIEIRRELIGGEKPRYHLLGCSVLEDEWIYTVSVHGQRPFLFLAEGVFMYFKGPQVKLLVLSLREHFPGAELVFDAYGPISAWRHNLRTSTTEVNIHINWGIWRGREVEKWGNASQAGSGIHLLDEWGYFDDPTPRLQSMRRLRPIEDLVRSFRIYRFRLGKALG